MNKKLIERMQNSSEQMLRDTLLGIPVSVEQQAALDELLSRKYDEGWADGEKHGYESSREIHNSD